VEIILLIIGRYLVSLIVKSTYLITKIYKEKIITLVQKKLSTE